MPIPAFVTKIVPLVKQKNNIFFREGRGGQVGSSRQLMPDSITPAQGSSGRHLVGALSQMAGLQARKICRRPQPPYAGGVPGVGGWKIEGRRTYISRPRAERTIGARACEGI